jgi:hypothetical protein
VEVKIMQVETATIEKEIADEDHGSSPIGGELLHQLLSV